MRIQHNISALNSHRQLGSNNNAVGKNLEKLSSGFKINRAGDDAAGLAISEKMRSQIRGLETAQKNSQDGISLIQTAEGALTEVHSMLNRMVELSTQASNGTYSDTDRKKLNDEITELKNEVNRISKATNFNGINLLDGSLGGGTGAVGAAGPKFGLVSSATGLEGSIITADKAGVDIAFAVTGITAGNENAVWNAAGTTLTINVAEDKVYTQEDIDKLIDSATQVAGATADPAKVTLKLAQNFTGAAVGSVGATVAGKKATASAASVGAAGASISFEMNTYGAKNFDIKINFTAKTNAEAFISTAGSATDVYTVQLQAGKEYTAKDIESLLQSAGLNVSVKTPDDSKNIFGATSGQASVTFNIAGGAGVDRIDPKESKPSAGLGGLSLQVGDTNQDFQKVKVAVANMSATALGIGGIDISTYAGAGVAMTKVNQAIEKVSTARGGLGALQNRLEHTINNLGVTTENLTASESRIRDVDMAKEMMDFTKNNILTQAAQAMLAQANQLPQGVLQLLR